MKTRKRKQQEKNSDSPTSAKEAKREGESNETNAGGLTSFSLVFCPNDDEDAAVSAVAAKFPILDNEQARGAVKLAQTLQKDDPGIFISLRDGAHIRAQLRRNGADGTTNGRPCDAGNNGGQALQNLKNYICKLVPAPKQQSIRRVGQHGIGIGNLTQDEFNALQLSLSFSQTLPLPSWVGMMAMQGHSLGGILSVTGTGVGQATMSKSPSNVLSD